MYRTDAYSFSEQSQTSTSFCEQISIYSSIIFLVMERQFDDLVGGGYCLFGLSKYVQWRLK